MATPLGTILYNNKETTLQCNGKNAEPITVKNLVIHFDQEKFEELLFGDGLAFHARKHRKVSVAKVPLAIDQKQLQLRLYPTLCQPRARVSKPCSNSLQSQLRLS